MKLHELHESEERSVHYINGPQEAEMPLFNCGYERLTSLVGSPERITGDFFCNNNNLSSFEGAPSFVGGDFYCYHNKFESLRGINKHVKHIGGDLCINENPLKSHVLGVLRIKGLKRVVLDNKKLQIILNKYLGLKGDIDIFACQEELIDAGFEEFAQL